MWVGEADRELAQQQSSEASTTSPGNLIQCFTTLLKNVFLISTLNQLSFSLKPLPLVLSKQALLKWLSPSFL